MTENRYRYDTGSIIDQETGEILTTKQAVNRLNRQDTLLKQKNKTIKFHADGYNKVIQTIKEAYQNERTQIGRNVLKQLLNNIGEI